MTRLLDPTESTTPERGARPPTARTCWLAWIVGGSAWGASVWLLEGALSALSHPLDGPVLLHSGLATWFFYEIFGITTALVLGLLWSGVSRGHTPASALGVWHERWTELEGASSEARRQRLARVYSRLLVGLSCLWLAFYAARDVSLRLANRDNLGLALVGIQVFVLVFGLAAARVSESPIERALEWLGRSRSERFYRLGGHLAVVLAVCLGLVASVGIGFWPSIAELLRRYALPAGLGFCVAAASTKLTPPLCLRPRARRATSIALLALLCASGVSGVLVARVPRGPHAWVDAPVARIALEWGHLWLDWDRDAHLSGFGEQDCAPLDASVHPGALDVPGNRKDEDCDGADARAHALGSSPPDRPGTLRTIAGLPESTRPNLYLLTVDALAPWALETYAGTPGIAPSLDRFAKRSVVFENFFVQGPSTRLSFPALFTSRFDTRIDHVLEGRFPFELAPSNRMLAEVLADAGYDTFAVLPSPYFAAEHWRGLLQGFQGVATGPAEAYDQGVPHTASAVTAAALEFVQRPRQGPLFLWAHYFDAHPPHVLPDGEPERGALERDVYAAEVTHLDRHLARLMGYIVEHDPNYVIVVTSDHGMAFDEPRHQHDHYGYDLSTLVLHVPLIVRAPALAPARVAHLADALDLAPTLTDLARVKVPESFMGHSLVPLLSGPTSGLPRVHFAQLYLGEEALRGRDPLVMVSARTGEHNLVFDRRAGSLAAWRWQDDPEERHDRWPTALAALPVNRTVAPPSADRPSPIDASDGEDEMMKLTELKRALDAHLYDALAPR